MSSLYYICSLPNPGEAGSPRECISADPAVIEAFARREDRPGRGVYTCVSKLKPGARRRTLDTVGEVDALNVDIDAKDLVEDLAAVDRRLITGLLLPPSEVRNSGHHRHAVFALKEPIEASDTTEMLRAAAVLKRLTVYLCGDMAVAHLAALLRYPGTHNSKNGDWIECRRVESTGMVYELGDLESWLDDVESQPLFARRIFSAEPAEQPAPAGEHKPPIDVEARLAAMKLKGPGDSSIHKTQLSVTASLLRSGVALKEAARIVLDATRAAVADDPQWDWCQEELTILRMGCDFIVKKPELATLLPDKWREPFKAALAEGRRPDIGYNASGFYFRAWKNKTAEDANSEPASSKKAGSNGEGVHPRVILKPFVPVDPASLPRRQWLYGRHYQRRVVSATIAPGGTGKTSLVMVEAVALATCRNLLGEQPEVRCRVWLHNGEDSREELNRRVVAICQHYKIPQQELQDWLFLTSGTEMALKVANGYGDLKVDSALVAEMTNVIADNSIDVVMFDPLVTLHSVNESDNGKMDTVIRIFAKLADACDCAVDISHHTRKLAAGSFDHTVDDTRGASSVRDAVRMLRILNIMSHGDAENLGFDDFERLSYFRVDRGKANAVAPALTATWRKFESIELVNGDNVGVVTPWDLPEQDTLDDQHKAEKIFLQLLDQYTASEREVNDRRHRNYAPTLFANEAVARAAKLSKAKLESAMRRLFSAGVIRCESYGRSDRLQTRIVKVAP